MHAHQLKQMKAWSSSKLSYLASSVLQSRRSRERRSFRPQPSQCTGALITTPSFPAAAGASPPPFLGAPPPPSGSVPCAHVPLWRPAARETTKSVELILRSEKSIDHTCIIIP
jgi:hypothetical protein